MTGKANSDSVLDRRRTHGWQLVLPAMFSLLSLLLMAQSVAYAQSPFQMPKKKYNNDNEFVPENLKEPPSLPYLPPYSGSAPPKYDSILAFKRKPEKPGFTLTFHVKETPEEVLAFYQNAFAQNKWKPQKGGDTTKIVSGIRKGALATVTIMKPVTPGYKTQVYIVYKVSGPIQ